MRSQAVDHQPAGHDNLRRDDAVSVPSLLALEVLDHLHRVVARPPTHGKQRVQPIRVSPRIGIGDHLAPAFVRGRIRYAPLDRARIERIFERDDKLTDLFVGEFLQHRCVLLCRSRRHRIGGPRDSCGRLHFICSFLRLSRIDQPRKRTQGVSHRPNGNIRFGHILLRPPFLTCHPDSRSCLSRLGGQHVKWS
jgi:hypothetical protein